MILKLFDVVQIYNTTILNNNKDITHNNCHTNCYNQYLYVSKSKMFALYVFMQTIKCLHYIDANGISDKIIYH